MGNSSDRRKERRLAERVSSILQENNKPYDAWLQLGGTVVGIGLYLYPNKTPLTVCFWLIAVFVLLCHPVWNWWWVEDRRWRQWSAIGGLLITLSLFGFWVWPSLVVITPTEIVFETFQANETYAFTLKNQSDQNAYIVSFKLRIESKELTTADFSVDIPGYSRVPVNGIPKELRVADIFGLACRDSKNRQMFWFHLYRLRPGETREVILRSKKGVSSAKITTEVRSQSQPKGQILNSGQTLSPAYFDEAFTPDALLMWIVKPLTGRVEGRS